MSLTEELANEATLDDKLRKLLSFFTTTAPEEIGEDFDLTNGIDKVDRDYYLEMIRSALEDHFGVPATTETVEGFGTFQDLKNYLNDNGVN